MNFISGEVKEFRTNNHQGFTPFSFNFISLYKIKKIPFSGVLLEIVLWQLKFDQLINNKDQNISLPKWLIHRIFLTIAFFEKFY